MEWEDYKRTLKTIGFGFLTFSAYISSAFILMEYRISYNFILYYVISIVYYFRELSPSAKITEGAISKAVITILNLMLLCFYD